VAGRGRWWLAAAALAVIGLGLIPAVQARGKAVAVLAEAVGAPFPRPFAPDVSREETTLDGTAGSLYAPDRPAPPILLVLGAAPRGPDDPRAVRLARALARAGRVVFAPRLTLAERRFDTEDLDRIVRAAVALGGHPAADGPVALLGISYGGSYALVASADPRLADRVAQVAVFGAYYDLVGVIQAATTGVSVADGRTIPWESHPSARAILESHAVQLAPDRSRAELRAVLDGRGAPASLDSDARAVYELLVNRDAALTGTLAAALSPEARVLLARFSPSSVVDGIDAPVIAMHSADDPAVPYAEALRLADALPATRLVTVRSFRHVDFQAPSGWPSLASDLWDAWRFSSWLLDAQE
jgi:alpha-beta hydrolase superfamily lysophospholipase